MPHFNAIIHKMCAWDLSRLNSLAAWSDILFKIVGVGDLNISSSNKNWIMKFFVRLVGRGVEGKKPQHACRIYQAFNFYLLVSLIHSLISNWCLLKNRNP